MFISNAATIAGRLFCCHYEQQIGMSMEPPDKSKTKSLPPRAQRKNSDPGKRKYLTPDEVKLLIESTKQVGRHADRDSTLILICYLHALRVGELITLRWDQLSLDEKRFRVERMKRGNPSVHRLNLDEVTALTTLRLQNPNSEIVFVSERNGALTCRAVHTIIARAAKIAGISFPVHTYMLRHSKGYQLGAKGVDTKAIQAYFGHRNIQHTVGYIPDQIDQFDGFEDD
jgi:type 1 fimbriae regulatory protein FimB/type 1 fimbriae regulatory protein FimE